jgi:probable DNA metabolism protein
VLPLLLDHFGDRFADQPWILYDARRRYGVLRAEGRFREIALEISLDEGGGLADGLLAERETLFQELWKSYCRAITIKERLNPRQQLRCMPRRFRPYLTELREARPTSFPRLSA